jgi:hypothetical protein
MHNTHAEYFNITSHNCLPCGLQFRRADNFKRHEATLIHQQNIEKYLLPSTDPCQNADYMPQMSTEENWYTNITENEDVNIDSKYNYHEKILVTTPEEIPLESEYDIEDPRVNSQQYRSIYTINTTTMAEIGLVLDIKEMENMFHEPQSKQSDWPWSKSPLLQIPETSHENTMDNFLDYLNKEITLAELMTDVNYQTEDLITPPQSPISMETDAEDFILSLLDMDTSDTWLTIDSTGQCANAEDLIPPAELNY